MVKENTKPDARKEQWLNQYREKRPIYERHCNKLRTLLEELLSAAGITYHVVESRAKTIESFGEKLGREGKGYSDPLNEISDLAGVRIILYYTDDVIRVSDLIDAEFSVDPEKSVDKKSILAPDQFGYLSVHKIIRISQSRAQLVEWGLSLGLTAEIQIRTVLQHSWAAISHALQYKHEADVPDEFRRRLTRLSGLLELADEEFASLREHQNSLRKDIAERVSEGDLNLSVDALSAGEFVRRSEVVKDISTAAIEAGMAIEDAKNYDDISQLVRACQLSNVLTISELQELLAKSKDETGMFFEKFLQSENKRGVNQTIGSAAHATAMFLIALKSQLDPAQISTVIGWDEGYSNSIVLASARLKASKQRQRN